MKVYDFEIAVTKTSIKGSIRVKRRAQLRVDDDKEFTAIRRQIEKRD